MGSTILLLVVYWIFGGIYTFLDLTNRPKFIRRYKIQPGTNEPVDKKRLFKVILNVIINQTVVTIPLAYLGYKLIAIRGFAPLKDLPTFHWVLLELAVFILTEEIGFYYSHR